jgi:hypothetical protein
MPASQVIKAIGSSYKGAAEGPIDNHMAISHNLAEMRTKNSNQDMLFKGVGGLAGFGLDKLGRHFLGPAAVPLMVAGAAMLRLWATHNYVNAIDLNPPTEKTVLKHVRGWLGEKSGNELGWNKFKDLELGCPAAPFVKDVERFGQLRELYHGRNYLLDAQDGKIRVLLNKAATGEDQQKAVFQAALVQRLQHSPAYDLTRQKDGAQAADRWAVETSLRALPEDALTLLGNLKAEDLRFEVGKNRAQWEETSAAPLPPLSKDEFKKLLQ